MLAGPSCRFQGLQQRHREFGVAVTLYWPVDSLLAIATTVGTCSVTCIVRFDSKPVADTPLRHGRFPIPKPYRYDGVRERRRFAVPEEPQRILHMLCNHSRHMPAYVAHDSDRKCGVSLFTGGSTTRPEVPHCRVDVEQFAFSGISSKSSESEYKSAALCQ